MPAGFLALLLGPFGRYRHGCDPPNQVTRFSFLPSAYNGKPLPLSGPSNIVALPHISPQLKGIEPFLNPFDQPLDSSYLLNR